MTYLRYSKGQTAPASFNEKDDCSVKSIANTGILSYEEAHCLCKEYGRPDKQGMYSNLFFKALSTLGIKESYRFKKDYLDLGGKLVKGCSIGKFRDVCSKGTWVVFISGHFTTIIDNVIIDDGYIKSKSHIIYAWKL